MTTLIYVNAHTINLNAGMGANDPPIVVEQGGVQTLAYGVRVEGPSVFVYSPNKPLASGARVFVMTEAEVVIISLDGASDGR